MDKNAPNRFSTRTGQIARGITRGRRNGGAAGSNASWRRGGSRTALGDLQRPPAGSDRSVAGSRESPPPPERIPFGDHGLACAALRLDPVPRISGGGRYQPPTTRVQSPAHPTQIPDDSNRSAAGSIPAAGRSHQAPGALRPPERPRRSGGPTLRRSPRFSGDQNRTCRQWRWSLRRSPEDRPEPAEASGGSGRSVPVRGESSEGRFWARVPRIERDAKRFLRPRTSRPGGSHQIPHGALCRDRRVRARSPVSA